METDRKDHAEAQSMLHDELLPTLTAIARRFGVGRDTARRWYIEGAPIAKSGTRYKALLSRLQEWLLQHT